MIFRSSGLAWQMSILTVYRKPIRVRKNRQDAMEHKPNKTNTNTTGFQTTRPPNRTLAR